MKKSAILFVWLLCLAVLVPSSAMAEDVAIQVAPNVLNLDSQGTWVTIHTDIPYGLVDGASVTLNGIEVSITKADDCGDFVAKFALDAVKDIVSPGTATLTLAGETITGELFTGSADVTVVSAKKKR